MITIPHSIVYSCIRAEGVSSFIIIVPGWTTGIIYIYVGRELTFLALSYPYNLNQRGKKNLQLAFTSMDEMS